ncbi:hypothetical protein KUL42_32520 [Alteromonas sp. KUL42]|uniref:hypothetical protein n=1 Tax=Alteromonas sp. KUL42 TaxID=2480797 RepID=UPI001035780B|nr:hypothetical protein [Alteromonas sp. KUL42]TAP33272.1 hypothetical protein EYR97_15320 [Alteromonas sp. KUL42]GEA08491.1 hypothetical protein KUL42_32520 [Alteromonas sp. KUL42]
MVAITKATAPIDPAGNTLRFCAAGAGAVDTLLPNIPPDSFPQVNSGDQFDDVTPADETSNRKYRKKTLPEDQDFELVLWSTPGVADQKTFTDMVKAKTPINIELTYSSGDVVSALFLPHDHYASSGEKSMFACIGKLQSISFDTVVEA